MSAPRQPVLLQDLHPWSDTPKLVPHLVRTPGAARHLLRRRAENGLDRHLIQVGRTFYVTEAELRAWVEERRGRGAAGE